MKKVIYEDLVKIFLIKEPDLLFRLFKFVSYKPGIFVDYSSISVELGISRNTISMYFEYLEKSFLVKKVYNFSNNLISSEKKLKRYYTYPSLHYLNDNICDKVESYILMQAKFNFFHRDHRKNEVDFICDNPRVLGEVKYHNFIKKEDVKNLLLFKSRFKAEQLILVKKYSSQIMTQNTDEILFINPWEIEE